MSGSSQTTKPLLMFKKEFDPSCMPKLFASSNEMARRENLNLLVLVRANIHGDWQINVQTKRIITSEQSKMADLIMILFTTFLIVHCFFTCCRCVEFQTFIFHFNFQVKSVKLIAKLVSLYRSKAKIVTWNFSRPFSVHEGAKAMGA